MRAKHEHPYHIPNNSTKISPIFGWNPRKAQTRPVGRGSADLLELLQDPSATAGQKIQVTESWHHPGPIDLINCEILQLKTLIYSIIFYRVSSPSFWWWISQLSTVWFLYDVQISLDLIYSLIYQPQFMKYILERGRGRAMACFRPSYFSCGSLVVHTGALETGRTSRTFPTLFPTTKVR